MLDSILLGFLIGLTGAMAPGPTLVATINSSLQGGWKMGPFVAAGHAVVEAVVFLLIIVGMGSLLSIQIYSHYIAVFGGIALVVFGLLTLRGAGHAAIEANGEAATGNPYVAGAVTSMANPYFWIWWLTVGSALVLAAAQQAFLFAVTFLIGHWAADFGWYTLVSVSIHQGRKVLDRKAYTWVLRACGLFLICFGIYYALFSGLLGE